MNVEATLLQLEEQFWKGDSQFYRQNLTEDAEMVLPPPAGVLNKSETIEAVGSGPRWTHTQFVDAHVIRLADDAAVLIYRAIAQRNGDESRYEALASSAYVRRNGAWKLACHQQTPFAT
jgi:hypothetical protein